MNQLNITDQTTQIDVEMTVLEVDLASKETGEMPFYSGSIFRGMIGKKIRDKSCIMVNQACETCPHLASCTYGSIYEPTSEVFAPAMSNKTKYLSPPLVIEAPFFRELVWEKGETKTVRLTLFGSYYVHAYHFIRALMELGDDGGIGPDRLPFEVVHIRKLQQHGPSHSLTLAELEDDQLFSEKRTWKKSNEACNQLLISFRTPIRLKRMGEIQRELDVSAFFQSIYRRVEYVSSLYGNIINDLSLDDYVQLVNQLEITHQDVHWQEWIRYSGKQKTKMELGGLTGSFQITGELSPLMPYLRSGGELHIGKQTVFGLGGFQIWQPVS